MSEDSIWEIPVPERNRIEIKKYPDGKASLSRILVNAHVGETVLINDVEYYSPEYLRRAVENAKPSNQIAFGGEYTLQRRKEYEEMMRQAILRLQSPIPYNTKGS